jgi:Class III cytochrome C family
MAASNPRRIAVALTLGGALLLSPPVTSGGVVWDIGIGAGYICVVLLLYLYVYPLRGDGLPHGRLLGLSQHRLLGWWMLGVALAHTAVLIVWQPTVGRYLLPSAPLFMWCGMLAVVFLAVLVQTGLSARSSMRRSSPTGRPPKSATLHIILAAATVLTLSAHVIGSAQVASSAIKTATIILLIILPLAWFAFRPRSSRSHQSALRRLTHVSAVALIPLMPSPTASRLLLEPVARPSRITVTFPHESHTSVNCVACHHNYIDHTGVTGCIDCHRNRRADLPHSSEATFHRFCRDCHSRLALDGAKHGPTRACSACH